ncbi:molybdopterin-dependent oxidoreductase [Thermanaeromonas sp. C210]|uniref:molybdopterin-dependent oxidoreductase n=1 Tax=Thermanaeromonas sp. C210 TaxID=2731925 RepID=UPI00155CAE97|nr:molybdopterin-dependent oxidoreductase [Thermanaeromonas sp. C210]GFN22232.1 molybdopterin oxidoreductase [Thermanaeromonas sp. C210]
MPKGFLLSRRQFLKTSALVGGSALLLSRVDKAFSEVAQAEGKGEYPLTGPASYIPTVCLQCNTGCGIKAKIYDGVVVKIDGNPFNPWTLHPPLPYGSSLREAANIDGAICPKGQAGIQTLYDPYRLRKVLKRAGKRGENKWVTIPFEQAVEEIVNGGYLFKDVPGEESRYVPGLREIYALRDAKLSKDMAQDVKKIWAKEMTVEQFKDKYRDHLKLLIDPDHPDLGPQNNQLVFMWGRLKKGREEFIKRFVQDGFGSLNTHGHTTVCQGSLYFLCKAMSEQYVFSESDGKMKWAEGQKFYWQADLAHARFALLVGASPFEANYGPSNRIPDITEGLASGRLKYAVIDPRFSKTAAKAWKWLPNKPGTEAAPALAIIRWMIDNRRFDETYVRNANKAAAQADGEASWTNATWLVKVENGNPVRFLRGSDLGWPKQIREAEVKGQKVKYEFDPFVVLSSGRPVPCDPNDDENPVEGDLLVDTVLNGHRVKSSLQLLYDEARKKSFAEWAEVAGVDAGDLEEIAIELTSYGKAAAVDVHRGVSQHTNGFYNVFAWMCVNVLLGNFNWAGGMVKATTYDHFGDKEGKPYKLKELNPGKLSPFGISIIRHEVKYEDTTLFAGYPSARPWYPLSSDVYQEIIPSLGDGYPYPVKALFLYMGSPVYSLPAGQTNIEILRDPQKLPLFVAIDITVGETSMYADYIFPDLTYLERWEFHGSHPSVLPKVQPVRQPAVAPLTETVRVFGEEQPLGLEALLLALAEKLGLPNFGPDGFGPGQRFTKPEDFYLKMVANLAFGDKADGSEQVPDADPAEVEIFLAARRHLPPTVFDPERWERAAGRPWWGKVVYVLNRGGRFEDYPLLASGQQVKNKYDKQINIFQEKTATSKNSMTGKNFVGVATYIEPYTDCLGRPLGDGEQGYNLKLITFKDILHTKSRTMADYWLHGIMDENLFLVHPQDAAGLGLRDGDVVKVVSASNPEGIWPLAEGLHKPIVGKVKITPMIRQGTVTFSLGFGHWAYGAGDITIDGHVVKGDPRRARGVHANAAMRVDPVLKNTCLTDLPGGSAVFYDTLVKLVKVS